MNIMPPDDFEIPSAGLRVVIASAKGVTTDHNGVRAVRIGHSAGFSLLTAATGAGEWRFVGCGIEWLCRDGHIERHSAAEAMVEVIAPGIIAIACRSAGPPAGK